MPLPATSTPALAPPGTRLPALDAARAFALLMGIVFHGMESLTFAKAYGVAQDTQGSLLLEAAYYCFHIFRMQLFFLMAGFFAHLLYHRQGVRGFVANRTRRLVLPLLLFWPANYLLVAGLWEWQLERTTHLSARQAFASLPPDFRFAQGVPLLHLWFLYFLILFCLAVALLRPALGRWPAALGPARQAADHALAWVLRRWWSGLALGLLMVWPMLDMRSGFGADTPEHSLWPLWPSFFLYALYFGLGWLLQRQPGLLDSVRGFRVANLGLSLLFIGALFALKLRFDFQDPLVAGWLLPTVNFLYAFASMVTVLAFLGYVLAYFSRLSAPVRYLSDAAYWGYLIHLPVLIFFQILVAPYFWPWPVKLLLILAPTFLLLLASYQALVRPTWLGQLLNGRTYPRPLKPADTLAG